jgi:uncharacterized membrane protein YGL010W
MKNFINNYNAYLNAYFELNRDSMNKAIALPLLCITASIIFSGFILFQIDSWSTGSDNLLMNAIKLSSVIMIVALPFIYGGLVSLSISAWLKFKRKVIK